MIYSYTQISHYLRCPRSYRYRYLDGWREKDTPAVMAFGRCFEKALGLLRTTGLYRGAVQRMGSIARNSV
jgi:PD-(D/E)XK nuclease superfamily